ncbi:UDP-2,4-diacetamido-2,4,6-trideoxy-beta-L-altropyranose hydrolase [Pseudomonas sp. 5P_5.1_Bac1]|uniref:UDP-2,4-diacetamido-2,4, 6-trideoxy-beta-L-altropyranose hydrolase n=1 Tax=Pseudomonas sp. 5P_5.1_Bac1 TaxID=2971616 RepID=UPI0021C5B1CB|nr:UDP-2,4-diacetamido-2,4,6-trideoxy-beta-L-altropyranose hydrolase [Pseudomonas sp. 5P_5.1_Bac1]MCU1723873.1 UDP-2,4-diacetamido-2,4,6-trideoxy-beta-L-altropyranose hydrolase [Pseudomonas sp. 5P_5.1_Bac1]
MKVLFRADAGSHLGIGHVARCLTLAQVLASGGAQISFACRALPGHQMQRIAAAGHEVFSLPADTPDEIPALQALLPTEACFDWILVDHYQFDARWESAARCWGRRVMAIDDLADRPHDCDLLLDQNFTASAALYHGWVPAACQILAGPRHALLRPAFRELRPAAQAGPSRVLVSFGGFDQAGMTLRTLQALDGLEGVEVQCIAGHSSPDLAALQSLVARHPGWTLLNFVNDLPERMAAATLFIGAGGGTTWERAAIGLPSLCIGVAPNQYANAEALAQAGLHLYLGPAEQVAVAALHQAIAGLLGNLPQRQHFAARGMELVDGLGAQRVALALFQAAGYTQAAGHFEQVLKDSQHEQF